MWSRRRFLEIVSGLPLVGGLIGAGAVSATAAQRSAGRDYFRELGVRPFINAAGTYTAMTASLSAEVVGGHYAPTLRAVDELHDRVGATSQRSSL